MTFATGCRAQRRDRRTLLVGALAALLGGGCASTGEEGAVVPDASVSDVADLDVRPSDTAERDGADAGSKDMVLDAGPDSSGPISTKGQLEWFSAADVHVHTACSATALTVQDILRLMKKNKVNIASVLIWGGKAVSSALPSIETEWMNFRGQMDDPVSEANYIVHWDLEISQLPGASIGGHLVMLNLADKNVVKDGKVGYPGRGYLLPNFKYAHDQGAVAGYAHVGNWVSGAYEQARLSVSPSTPRELPVDIVLDRVDFVSDEMRSAAPDSLNPGLLWIWYRMLDAGFNIPVLGASDNGCRFDAETIGITHTVFGLEKGATISYANFMDAIRRGNTLIRNNAPTPDMLELRINDVNVGGEIVVPGQQEVDVEVIASTGVADRMVELVVNGVVAKSEKLSAGSARTFKWPVRITKSSWVAARTKEAHTSAIQILVGGCPVRNDPTGARKWITYAEDWYLAKRSAFASIEPEVRAKVNLAKAAWERIAREGEGTLTPVCKSNP
jgi:hypothetical protein